MRERFDGFAAEKRKRFLKVLAETGCVSDAARAAGVSRKTANYWRAKDERFAGLCQAAIDSASSHIETLAWERAVTGIEEPVWYYGKQVGTRVKRSEGIFRMLLMASNGVKYGRMGKVKQKQIEELRPRIEREIHARLARERRASAEGLREELERKLDAIAERLRGRGSGGGGG